MQNQFRHSLRTVMYHRIDRAEDEQNLLQEMLSLQSQIREKRERNRNRQTNVSEKYAKMFAPVTKTLEKLAPAAAPPAPVADLLLGFDDPLTRMEQPMKDEDKKDDDTPVIDIDDKLQTTDEDDPPGELFQTAFQSIPARFRDDGLLGLDTFNHRIGDFEYRVHGNTLNLYGKKDSFAYDIDDIRLWKLLLVKNPKSISLHILADEDGGYLPFVDDYREIGKRLGLADVKKIPGLKKRIKYKLLTQAHGSGFLFTVRPPTANTVAPSTVVIPSDNQGILRALYVALAELRAGNNSMRNVVVPLAQEAARKGILPSNLLSADEETWVFA